MPRPKHPMEDELFGQQGMPQGGPMMPPDMGGMPEGMPGGMPPDMGGMPGGMPMPEGMPGEMPGGMPPEMGGEPEMPGQEGQLPETGVVEMVDEQQVVIQTDVGIPVTLPLDAFPYPPHEGQMVVRAVVTQVTGETMHVLVGTSEVPAEIPANRLLMEFNPGDFFWMPEPPSEPPDMGEVF